MSGWGICFGPAWGSSIAELLEPARAAEEAGFDRVATGEYRNDAITWLALLAQATSRVHVATTIASIALRHPSVVGEAIAALRDVHGERIELGLGISHRSIVTEDLGLEQPTIQDLEFYVRVIREVVSGRGGERHGRYLAPAHERRRETTSPPSILVSVLGERAATRAAGYADGVILTWTPPGWVEHISATVRQVDRTTGGRTKVWSVLPTLLHDDLDVARRACAMHLSSYLRLPAYRHMLVSATSESDRIDRVGNVDMDPSDLVDALGTTVLDEVGAVGPPGRINEAVEQVRAAGADEVILYPLDCGSGWHDALWSTITRCAPGR